MTAGIRWTLMLSAIALTACGDEKAAAPAPPVGGQTPAPAPPADGETPAPAPPKDAEPPAPAPPVEAAGNVVEIEATTDDDTNRFEPDLVEVKRGDTLRVVLASGVHNISFPAASNPGASGLPGPSKMLQRAGQKHDVLVNLAPGTYNFQCDQHASLGMMGRLEVAGD